MPQLSVVIITFNEEKNIARCLESVKTIADEIIVLDSFSKDRTQAICESFGVKFFQHAFDGHIQQKNRALSYSTFNHILSLDADEALDQTLTKSIQSIKNNWTKDGYTISRLTNYCGHWVKHCGWYPDVKLRLFDKTKGAWTGTNPHDKLELFNGNQNTAHLTGDLLHYSYYTLSDHYKQVEYFTTIASKAFVSEGKKAPLYKLIINPISKFLDHYLFKLGFLDGKAGYLISKISAYATYLKYKKIRLLTQQQLAK